MFEWMIPIIALLSVFLAAVAIQAFLRAGQLRRKALQVADLADRESGGQARQSTLERLFFRSLPILAQSQGRLVPPAWGIKVEKKLMVLPKWSGRQAAEWVVVKELALLGGLLAGSVITTDIMMVLLTGLVAFFLPDLWLHEQTMSRKKALMRALPDTLDLLASCMEAGLGFEQSVGIIQDRNAKGPLTEELGEMMRGIRMGRSRSDALKAMGLRVDDPDFSTFVTALIQAEKLGVSVADTLKQQAVQLRMKRSQAVEKQALEAPIKLLFPLILFIFPVVFIILFGPIVIRFMQGF